MNQVAEVSKYEGFVQDRKGAWHLAHKKGYINTFSNLTQAYKAAAKHPGSEVCGSHPFFVVMP